VIDRGTGTVGTQRNSPSIPAIFRFPQFGWSTGILGGYLGGRGVLVHDMCPAAGEPLLYLLVVLSGWMGSFMGGTFYNLIVHGPSAKFAWHSRNNNLRVLTGSILVIQLHGTDAAWVRVPAAINMGCLVAMGASQAFTDLANEPSLPRKIAASYLLAYTFFAGGSTSRDVLFAAVGTGGGRFPPGGLTPAVFVPLSLSLLSYFAVLRAGLDTAAVVVGVPTVALIFLRCSS
jgi:hypothetical protein